MKKEWIEELEIITFYQKMKNIILIFMKNFLIYKLSY